jgi:hypothetical protein
MRLKTGTIESVLKGVSPGTFRSLGVKRLPGTRHSLRVKHVERNHEFEIHDPKLIRPHADLPGNPRQGVYHIKTHEGQTYHVQADHAHIRQLAASHGITIAHRIMQKALEKAIPGLPQLEGTVLPVDRILAVNAQRRAAQAHAAELAPERERSRREVLAALVEELDYPGGRI